MNTETKTQHAPGPWIILNECGGDYETGVIAHEWRQVMEAVRVGEEATGGNVAVLALSIPQCLAAPELLAACKAAATRLSIGKPFMDIVPDDHYGLNAAIAKATGDKP